MSQQVPKTRTDVLPLRLDQEIRDDEKESRKSADRNFKELSRSNTLSVARRNNYTINYRIDDSEVGFEDILNQVDGQRSRVLEKEFDEKGAKSTQYVKGDDIDFKDYLEWFFLPEEVFDVRKVDVMADDTPAWNDVYWVGGYSDQEESYEFGPFDSFEGPSLRYAMVALDEQNESLFDNSSLEVSIYHPEAKLDQYTEDGTFPQDVLREGPNDYLS